MATAAICINWINNVPGDGWSGVVIVRKELDENVSGQRVRSVSIAAPGMLTGTVEFRLNRKAILRKCAYSKKAKQFATRTKWNEGALELTIIEPRELKSNAS